MADFRERMLPLLPSFTAMTPRKNQARNISLFSVEWYKSFVEWLQDETKEFPGEITNQALSQRLNEKEALEEHKDYEVVEKGNADAIFNHFKGGPQILRPLLPDPKTQKATIILYPIKLTFNFDNKSFVTTVDPDWALEDIKGTVGAKRNFDPTTATFLAESTGVIIPDETKASEIAKLYGSKIQITLPGSLKPRSERSKTSSCGSVGSVPQALRMNLISEGCLLNAFIQILCRVKSFCEIAEATEIPEDANSLNDTPTIAFIRYFKEILSNPQKQYQSESAPAALAFNASIVNKTDEINSIRHFDFPLLFSLLTREVGIGKELFAGEVMQSKLCPKCGYYNEEKSDVLTINLDISSKWYRKTKIEHCLEDFVEQKKRKKTDRWECPKCHKMVLVREQTKIIRSPDVLIIFLKRFVKSASHDINVISDEVLYGPTLSLAPYTGNKDDEYHLIGSIAHVGRSFTQRYKALVLEPDGKHWTMYNDGRSRAADPRSVFFPEPLMLVYQRN